MFDVNTRHNTLEVDMRANNNVTAQLIDSTVIDDNPSASNCKLDSHLGTRKSTLSGVFRIVNIVYAFHQLSVESLGPELSVA